MPYFAREIERLLPNENAVWPSTQRIFGDHACRSRPELRAGAKRASGRAFQAARRSQR